MHPEPTDNQRTANARPPTPIPHRLWWMLACVILALVQTFAAWRTLAVPAELRGVVQLPLQLDFVAGVMWALVFVVCACWLLQNRQSARLRALMAGLVFIIYSVLRLMLFAVADYDRGRLWVYAPLLLIVTLIGLIYLFGRLE
jgi:hypothetical protein